MGHLGRRRFLTRSLALGAVLGGSARRLAAQTGMRRSCKFWLTGGRRMRIDETRNRIGRRLVGVCLLGAAVCGFLAACSTVPYPPTYTEAELKAICERRGGWWRGELIAGYCEYQAASLTQAP